MGQTSVVLSRILDYLRDKATTSAVVRRALLVLLIVAALYGLQALVIRKALEYFDETASGLAAYVVPVDETTECVACSGDGSQKELILDKLVQVNLRAGHHLALMRLFYRSNYSAITLATICSIFAAVCLLFISKSGWENANGFAVTVFFVLSSAAVYFGLMPNLYRQPQNIADNRASYVRLLSLANETHSWLLTGQDISGEESSPGAFAHYIDRQLADLEPFAVGFDASSIPSPTDVLKRVQDEASGGS